MEERGTDIDRQISLLILKAILLLLLKEITHERRYMIKIEEFYREVLPYLGGWKVFGDPSDEPPNIG